MASKFSGSCARAYARVPLLVLTLPPVLPAHQRVKYAVHEETREAVAIKVLDKEMIQKQNMGEQIKREITVMRKVKHQYVVGLKEVLATKTKICIVLELIAGGELYDKIISQAGGKFNEPQARFYFKQLITGIAACHAVGVCHRDIKPENLLLDEDMNLRISDFGLSRSYTQDESAAADKSARASMMHTTCGTPNYVAPEVLEDRGYDGRMADVWSCGVVLFAVLAGYLPFDEPTIPALFKKIQDADFSYPAWFSPEVRSVLSRILVADPEERMSLADILADPWVTNPDALGFGSSTTAKAAMVAAAGAPGAAAAAAPAPAPSGGGEVIQCDGWLQKKGKGMFGGKKWAPRYFKVMLAGGGGGYVLQFFAKPSDKSPKGEAVLAGSSVELDDASAAGKFGFNLVSSAETFCVYAESGPERDRWVSAINSAIAAS